MRKLMVAIMPLMILCLPLFLPSLKTGDSLQDANGYIAPKRDVITFHYANHTHQTWLRGSTPNGGAITCKAYVNPASPCEGKGSGYLAPNTYLITPATELWVPNICDEIKCVTTDWKTWGYSSTVNASGKIYNWTYGIIYACTSNNAWCADPIDRWTSIAYSPVVKITNAPAFVPLVIYIEYVYEAQDKKWETLNVNQELLLGYG